MNASRIGELAMLAAIAVLVAFGGRQVLGMLGQTKLVGGLLAFGAIVVAAGALRAAYDVGDPLARVNVTKAGAYFCAAILALWAVLAPARWVFGSCIVCAEAALVLDFLTIVNSDRPMKGN